MDAPLEVPDYIGNHYLYSYGGISRFFREVMENRRFMGTRCEACGVTRCPPRLHCPTCYGDAAWVPLGNEGTVRSATYCYYVPSNYSLHRYLRLPYVLGYVQLDGAENALYAAVHVPEAIVGSVPIGTRVRAVFREKREGRITDFYFVPQR